jgi:hypothetical protein
MFDDYEPKGPSVDSFLSRLTTVHHSESNDNHKADYVRNFDLSAVHLAIIHFTTIYISKIRYPLVNHQDGTVPQKKQGARCTLSSTYSTHTRIYELALQTIAKCDILLISEAVLFLVIQVPNSPPKQINGNLPERIII